uniref:Uncharacterized protein n=1 Tax=Rhizophora mucronata TaxID=61149 RepID=A0A2P2JII9_RHIMU
MLAGLTSRQSWLPFLGKEKRFSLQMLGLLNE